MSHPTPQPSPSRSAVFPLLPRRGFTLVELLVVMAIIALLLAILLPALTRSKQLARQVKDATQVKQIHTAFLTFSRSFEGRFPTPGLINRLGGTPGQGAEDISKNSHAALYSACIAQNYFSPQLCVSPSEASGNVAVHSTHNFNAFNVATETYWDRNFRADLLATSHLSYGTLHLDGTRKARQWRESVDSKFAVVGNRGVQDGSYDDLIYNASKTLEIHGGRRSWEGNIVYNDNHVAYETSFTPERLTKLGANLDTSDNLFRNDPEGTTADVWLTMIKSVNGGGGSFVFEITWD